MERETRDEYYMRSALAEAEKALSKQEVPVGAVVVCNDQIIARAHNLTETLTDPTAHAEMQVITAAASHLGGKYLQGCTVYVTVEPCPMCAGAMAMWKITPSHTAVFLPKLPEWKMPELEAVQQLRDGWILTGDDTLQLEFFCHRAGFREAFPQKCR